MQQLLLLKRALLGDPKARPLLASGGRSGAPAPQDGAPVVVLLAGDADSAEHAVVFDAALADSPAPVRAVAPAGPLRDRWVAQGARTSRPDTSARTNSTRDQALALWRSLATAPGAKSEVRVAALAGAAAEDILLFRALGATLARIETPGTTDLGLLLLNGAAGVVPLPVDRMTVRAFLRPGRWPTDHAAVRTPIAAELHRGYVARRRLEAFAGDSALEPWPTLSPWLGRSNLAVVDDIPNKLAAIGLQLAPLGAVSADVGSAASSILTENLELLAELEHGRFVAERLLSGWTSGARDPARFLSPDLQPWSELDEEGKERDRDLVRNVPAALARHGLGVRPVTR